MVKTTRLTINRVNQSDLLKVGSGKHKFFKILSWKVNNNTNTNTKR